MYCCVGICRGLMKCRPCLYMWKIIKMYCCVGIFGGLMRCKLCRYMWGINDM